MELSSELKELIENRKFEDLINLIITLYMKSASEQERKKTLLDLVTIGSNFPNEINPLLIEKLEEFKEKKQLINKDSEEIEEITEELKEETELQDITHEELLKALCQIAIKNSKESIELVPTLIGECAKHNLYETCDKTIGSIQSADPEGTINELAKALKGKKDVEYRWRFALYLGKIGVEYPDLVEHIIPLLSDVLESEKDEKVRAAATEAMSLIRIETTDEETVKKIPIEEIEAQSKDKSELVKDIAKEKLDEIKQVSETEKLIQEVKNGSEDSEKTKSEESSAKSTDVESKSTDLESKPTNVESKSKSKPKSKKKAKKSKKN